MLDFTDNVSLQSTWDTRSDFKTGRRYYVNNNFVKHNGFDDPLIGYKKLQAGETLSIQTYSSSPVRSSSGHFFHLNQDMNLSSGRPSPVFSRSYSPLMGSNAIHYHAHKLPDLSSVDNSIIRIKALFPTVNENHIKTLLQKYHHRENLVISALQVEKHPLATPGPYAYPIATAAKHIAAQFMPSASGSPSKFISSTIRSLSPKSIRSSPKLKLRYLKNVFPVVEETVLLDTLSNSENNVHKATQRLQTMGFNKRDTYPQLSGSVITETKYKTCDQIIIPLHEETSEKFINEKDTIVRKLQDKFEKVSDRVIVLALEAVEYDMQKADQILSTSLTSDSASINNTKLDVTNNEKKMAIDLHEERTSNKQPNNENFGKEHDIIKSNELTEDVSTKVETQSVNEITNPGTNQITTSGSSTDENMQLKTDIDENDSAAAPTTNRSVTIDRIVDSGCDPIVPEIPDKITSSQYGGFKETVNRLFNNIFRNGKVIAAGCGNDRIIPKGPNKSLLSARCIPKGPNSAIRVGPNPEYRKSSKTRGNSLFTTYIAMKSLSSSH